MRVGIVVSGIAETTGGANTFQHAIIRGLEYLDLSHEIFLLCKNSSQSPLLQPDRYVRVDLNTKYPKTPAPPKQTRILTIIRKLNRAIRLGYRHSSSPISRSDLSVDGNAENRSDIYRAVEELAIDVVWFTDPFAEDLPIPYFVTVWDLQHRVQPFFPEVSRTGWHWDARESHYQKILPKAARVFCGTEVGKREIVKFYGVSAANVVVNPFMVPDLALISSPSSDDEILSEYGLNPGFLLYPAQFWPHKNHINLLHALAGMRSRFKLSPMLVLTGSDKGNMTHVKNVIDQLALQDQVRILGFVPYPHLAALYRNASALVFPTLFGPDNIPPLEAFAMNCPVIASDVDGAREQLGDAAVLFNATDPKEMATAIFSVLTDDALRLALAERGRRRVEPLTTAAYLQRFSETLTEFEMVKRNWNRDYMHT